MPAYIQRARKVIGKPRFLTLDEVRKKARQTIRAMPVDPYGFLVYARGNDRHNVYASPKMRKRASQLFAKAFPQQKDYADAYGIGMDMSYYTSGDDNAPIKPTPEHPDRKTNIGMWQSRNSVENSGRKFKIWAKAFDLGRRDGAALKQMHLAFRKTGQFPNTKVSSVLTHAKTLTADADTEEVDLIASIESIFHADGSKYFSAGAFDYARDEAMPPKSRTTLIMMHPKAFLAMAKNLRKPDVTKTANVASANGTFRDLPRLIFENNGDGTATVIGHEGRHRMYFLDSQNVQRVPVLFISQPGRGQSIRWGSATGFDAVDPWPKVLKGEENSNQMPFPVSEVYPRSIVSADYDYTEYGYWITDAGDLITVPQERHANVARNWIEKNNPKAADHLRDKDGHLNASKAFDFVQSEWGWVRVQNHGLECNIAIVQNTVTRLAYKTLRTYVEESPFHIFVIDTSGAGYLHKTFVDPKPALAFVHGFLKKTLTALIQAAEIQIQSDDVDILAADMTFKKIGTEKGRDFNGSWVLDTYDVTFGEEKVQLTVKRYPKSYTAKVNIFGNSTNKFGPANIRALIAFIKKTYKNVYSIYGDRISGARKQSGKLLNTAHIQIRKDNTVTATDREKHYGKSLYEQGKHDFLVIYRAVPRAEINFKPGDYVTLSKKFAIEHAEHVAAMGDPAHVIKIVADPRKVYDAHNPGEYFYGGEAKRGKVFYVASENLEGDDIVRSDLLASLQERMTTLHALAEPQTYTNKTKSVKLLYYANRSTPQTCKPGQTVKAKAGYGKRTKIKTATPEQVKQLKAGKWVRDRHDGKKPGEKGAKKTSYRPWLVASIEQRFEAAGLR